MESCHLSIELNKVVLEAAPIKSSDIKRDCKFSCAGSCCQIVARLTPWPRHIPKEQWLGNLYVESEGVAIVCELIGADNVEFPALVKLLEWNFVVEGSNAEGLLEVYEWKVVSPCQLLQPEELVVVDVSTASALLQNKDRLECKVVNITGEVALLSEVIRIKGEALFMVQLSSDNYRVGILVKKTKYLYWQKLLTPQMRYIITGLRPTTMYKGTEQETRLYIPWDKCQLFKVNLDVRFRVLSLEEWLVFHHEEALMYEEQRKEGPSLEICPGGGETYSYKGMVTSIDECSKGIYELDNKIRLYLTYVPAVHNYRQLKLGTEVVVYNAHHKGSPKHPKIWLCCCLVSCVKVTRFSSVHTSLHPFQHRECELVHLINRYNLPLQKLDTILLHVSEIEDRFKPEFLRNEGSVRLLFKALTTPSLCSRTPILAGKVRNMLEEFFNPGHQNCCAVSREDKNYAVCRFPTIAQIKESCEEYAQRYSEISDLAPITGTQLKDQVYWSKFEFGTGYFDKQWVVMGVLAANEVTGHVTLIDRSGSLDCAISPVPDSNEACRCCSLETESGNRTLPCHCHFIQPQHLGRLIRLDCYKLLVERFTLSNFPHAQDVGNEAFTEKVHFKTCILFSMKHVTFLSKYVDLCTTTKLITEKGSCIGGNIQSKAQQNLLDGASKRPNTLCKADGEKSKGCVRQKYKYKTRLFVLTHKDSLHIQSRVSNRPKLCFYASATFINENFSCVKQMEKGISVENPGDAREDPSEQLPIQHVALSFQNSSVRWYDILRAGSIYRLVYIDDGKSAFLTWGHQSLRRAVERTNIKKYLSIASDTQFIGIVPGEKFFETPLEKLSAVESRIVSKVMDHLSRNGLMSQSLVRMEEVLYHSIQEPATFRGRILSRRFTERSQGEAKSRRSGEEENERLGVSVPSNLNLCLTLGDLGLPVSDAHLKVYIDLHNMSYPLGLVEGAIVEVHKAQLKRSHRGLVYGQLLVSSSIYVVGQPDEMVTEDNRIDRSGIDMREMASYPFMKFCDLWQQCKVGGCTLHSVCHIHKLMSVSLWSDCSTCGNPHKLGSCTYMPCGSKMHPKVKAKARSADDIKFGDRNASEVYFAGGSPGVGLIEEERDKDWFSRALLEDCRTHVQTRSGISPEHPRRPGI